MRRETEIVSEMEMMMREMRDTEISEGRWRYRD